MKGLIKFWAEHPFLFALTSMIIGFVLGVLTLWLLSIYVTTIGFGNDTLKIPPLR